MRRKQLLLLGCLVAMLAAACVGPVPADEAPDVRVVKYAGLADAVLRNRGKVVGVAFWTTWSVYDARLLVGLADLHERRARDGLVVVTVNVDVPAGSDLAEPKVRQRVRRALQRVRAKAGFIDLVLDEPEEVVERKLRFQPGCPPCVYLFDRRGRWRQMNILDGPVTAGEVETRVGKLLRAK